MTWVSPWSSTACDEKIVMPRSRSIALVSRCESPSSTRPRLRMRPTLNNMASANVVLPASTCAKIPTTACFDMALLLLQATSPSHAATGVLVPHWMIQFTSRRAKRALSPDQAHRPALPRGDFRRFAPCESRLANQRSERKWPHPGPFSFVRIVDTCPYSYASRSQSNATRGVPSDTYTTPARSNPALILAPCMGRLS